MIKYTLKCDQDHTFDSWFQSSAAFDTLAQGGHLECAVCGSNDVTRSLMAPSVSVSRIDKATKVEKSDPDLETALQTIRDHVEKNSEYVGENFAEKARAMHLGDTPEKAIHGIANAEQAKSLIEDGVPVAPLPFIPKRKTN